MNQAEQYQETLATSDIIRASLDPCPAVLEPLFLVKF